MASTWMARGWTTTSSRLKTMTPRTYGSGGTCHHQRFKNATIIGNPVPDRQTIHVTGQLANSPGGNEFINLTVIAGGGTDFDHAFYIQTGDNLVENCDISNFTGAGLHIYNGYGRLSSGNILRNNVIHDGRATRSGQRHYGIILYAWTSNSLVYNNIIYGIPNEGSLSAGIMVGGGSAGSMLFNNTIYNNAGEGIVVESEIDGVTIRNNISDRNANGNYRNDGPGVVASNNLFDGADPRFIDAGGKNFRLQSVSPAVDAGVAIAVVSTDAKGVSRPQGQSYDIGAYEATTQAPPPAPPAPTGLHFVGY